MLMFMQYCKTDKAHYYRADASSFGLFNDNPQPNNTAYKSFCSYAAQSFGLFSKVINETPYILNQSNNFTTGLTTLAAENSAGNKMNILAANYNVDISFTRSETPPVVPYRQHYLDTNRTTNQLNDTWSKNEWFGGKYPNTLTYNNSVTQYPDVPNPPQYGRLYAKPRNYTQSNTGAGLTISNIASTYKGYIITAYRIKEGGRLDRMTPEEVTSSISAYMSNGTLYITDTVATLSTVTLYSVEFTTNGNTTNPGTGGNTGEIIDGSTGGMRTYTVSIPANRRVALYEILPLNYSFIANKQYIIRSITENVAMYSCLRTTVFNPAQDMCSTGHALTALLQELLPLIFQAY